MLLLLVIVAEGNDFAPLGKNFGVVCLFKGKSDCESNLALGQFDSLVVESYLFVEVMRERQKSEGGIGFLDVGENVVQGRLHFRTVLDEVCFEEGHFLGLPFAYHLKSRTINITSIIAYDSIIEHTILTANPLTQTKGDSFIRRGDYNY